MQIPVIDFKDFDLDDEAEMQNLADQVKTALTGSGFMSLKNLGISTELRERMFAGSKNFFDLPIEEKRRIPFTGPADNFGYQGVREEHLDPKTPPDLKESITMRNPLSRTDADWPDEEFRDLLFEFFRACLDSVKKVQRVFAKALDVEQDFFVDCHTGENITMRCLHYPPLSADLEGQLGAGAHTDYGMLTFLFQDMVGGLQVQDKNTGEWLDVKPVEDTILINTGDLMERWTNGSFLSTNHRVQPRGGVGDRYSIAIFFDPDTDTLIKCLPSCMSEDMPSKYPVVTAGEHILQKIEATQNH